MKNKKADILSQNSIFLWIAAATGLILSIPLFGQWPWSLGDFIVMGALIFGTSSTFTLAARRVRKFKHRIALAIVFLLALLYVWAELSVGIFTNLGS